MQIAVLAQLVNSNRVRAKAAFWRDGVPTTIVAVCSREHADIALASSLDDLRSPGDARLGLASGVLSHSWHR